VIPRPASARLLLLLVATLVLAPACRPPASTLPVMYPAPELALVDQRGAPFSSADAAGKVVVTNFIFTTCTDVCPLLTATMARARDELRTAGLLGAKVLLLSISVDPEQDSPEALATYAERFAADPTNWRFLTGDRAQIESLLVSGYKVGAPPRAPSPAGGPSPLVHSNRFVVVDPRGQIRWMPRGDELDAGQLVEEVRRLAA
jgi:protein SCO1/2